jgi:hypothetical protein
MMTSANIWCAVVLVFGVKGCRLGNRLQDIYWVRSAASKILMYNVLRRDQAQLW